MILILLIYVLLCVFLYLKNDNIPRIIHQTAPSDKSKWKKEWFECQKSWLDKHPDFEYKLWNDEDIENFMKTNHKSFYEEVFSKYDKHIKKVDAVRYFILNKYGGIYADMDYMCLKRFYEELNKNKKVYIAKADVEPDWAGHENALMISPVNNIFWDKVIENLKPEKDNSNVLQSTGPAIIDKTIREMRVEVISLKPDEFSPIHPNDGKNIKDFPQAKAYHMGTCSWC